MAYVSQFTALFDANVLYSARVREVLILLAQAGLFRAKWTEQINDEWTRNLSADRPAIPHEKLEVMRRNLNASVLDALVTGYEALIPAIEGLPDDNDRHVVAAAIVGRANIIVTYNTRDFPQTVLAPYGMEAVHPDEFIRLQIDLDEGLVCEAIKKHRTYLKSPPQDVDEYLDGLLRRNLPLTATALRSLRRLL